MTEQEQIKLIKLRIKEEISNAKTALNGDMDSPDAHLSYGMARGARWALEWVLALKSSGP